MSKTRKDEQLNINTMNVGRMDTWNTGGSLKKPSSGWEFGSGFPQQQNVDPRKAATNSQTLGDPRLAAANMSAAVDPSIALAFAQTMPAFNPADMGQMYAYQMGMMAMQAAQAQQAQQLNSQLLLPQTMPMSMHQPNHLRSGQTKANLTYGEYKKLQQMQKDPTYRQNSQEDAWNPDTQHLGDPRMLQQQKSVDSMSSGISVNPITKENWETQSTRDDEWERHQSRGTERYPEEKFEESSRRNSSSKNRHREDWQDGPLSPTNRSPSPNRSVSPRRSYYQQPREPQSHESKNLVANYEEDLLPKPRDSQKASFEMRGRGRGRGNYGRGRGNYNNNYNNGRNNNYNGGNKRFEDEYSEHKRDRRSPTFKRQNSYSSRRSYNDQENYDDRRRSKHEEYSPDRRRSDQDKYHERYNKYEKYEKFDKRERYDRRDDRRGSYSKGPRSPREPPRTPSPENNGDEEYHSRKSRSLNRDRREPDGNPPLQQEDEINGEENKNEYGRDSRNGRYPKKREGSVTSRRSNESTGSYNRQHPISSSSSRNSLDNGSREWHLRNPDRNGRSSRNDRPESPRDRPKSPVDPPGLPSRERSYSVSPLPAHISPSELKDSNGTNGRPKSPPALPVNWLFEKNRGRPRSPEFSRGFDRSESRSVSPVNRRSARYVSPVRSERSERNRSPQQRRVRSRSPIENRRHYRSRSASPVRAVGPRSPPESPPPDHFRTIDYEEKRTKNQNEFIYKEGKTEYRRSRFDIPDSNYLRKRRNDILTVTDCTMKKNKWESVEVSKQVKKEEYWSKKKVANHSDSNWDDDDFQGAIRDDFLPIEKETTKVSFENVEPTDWDDEDFQGTADKKTKEIVEEKKFTVETFKSLPETESWDDEDFPSSTATETFAPPVFNFKPISIKKDVWQIPKPPATDTLKPPEPMQVPDANDEIIKLDLSVPPPALPEEDTSEPLPPGVEFEEEYQPIVPSFSKEKKEPVIKLLPQSPVTIMDEPLPPGVKEQEDLENLTPIVKPTKSHRVKRKFTDSPAEVILNKILDNLDDIKNKSETECESSDLETLGAHENSQSDPIVTVIELESPASPDQDPVVDQQNQGANNLEVQEILEKIERDHLYPMKSKPIEESNGPDNFPQKCLKEDSSNLKEPAKTKVKASSSDDQKPINVEKSPRSPNPGGESVDHVPPPPTFKIQDEVIDLDSE